MIRVGAVNPTQRNHLLVQMTTRTNNNRGTALRRLMTEYKQLTAGGSYSDIVIAHLVLTLDYGLAGSPDGMFTAGQPSTAPYSYY